MRVFIGVVLNSLAVLAATSGARSEFDWATISPSKDLISHDCFGGFKCAPVVPDDDPAFAGSVFTNPGGPGGAGVGFMLRAGKGLRDVLDKPGRRHYEIVSFDPRGIGNSWPRANCFVHDTLGRDAISLELRGRGPLDGREGINVPYILAIQKAIGLRCQDAEASGINGGQIMAYMGTPSVARDMVHMVDKIAELRARDVGYRMNDGVNGESLVQLKRGTIQGDDDIPRLQYIGYSYGTVLGIYFASLFPGRVGRIALDGVVDVKNYSSGPGWMTNLIDTDEIANRFFSGCYKAGYKVCALSRNGDESDSSVKSRFYSWLSKLNEEPIATISHTGDMIVIRSQDIREMLGAATYRPRSSFITLATALDDAMAGDTTGVVKILFQRHIPHLDDVCAINNTGPDSEDYLQEGTASVLCADGIWYISQQISTSSIFGAYWSNIRMACNSWNFRPNWIFKGPFTTPPVIYSASGNPIPGHPAAPILFISNRLDPVTPLSAARAMAAQHPGAGLIITEGLGHGTMGTSDSACLHSHVADYFDNGVVPAGETTCIPDCGPWDIGCDTFGVEIVAQNSRGYSRGYLAF
ncbi:TAP-like domain-containing protein [Trichoderma velutinum]